MKQRTIAKEVDLEGIGIHSGKKVKVTLKPSLAGSGVSFIRVDVKNSPVISACISNIITRPRRTSIGKGNVEVHTVEHLMAALSGLGVDNIIVEINSDELPGLDGSAFGFVEAVKKAGLIEQDFEKKYFSIKQPVWIFENDSFIVVLPSDEFKITYTLSYDHPLLKAQHISLTLNQEVFEKELASSRTFCLEKEVSYLRQQGLGKGANYDNTIVIGAQGVINNKLRFPDEFVRHKVCDVIGDFYLLGCPIKGHVIAVKSGHPLNIKLIQKIGYQLERSREAGVLSQCLPIGSVPLHIDAIHKILPHRYPFLLIDRIIELEEDKKAVGIKNVSINEHFFEGHFPGRPIMPGVLIVEAMAQVGGVLMLSKPDNHGKLAYFMSMDKVKFRKTVVPGDQLFLEASVVKIKSKTGQVHTKALVDGKVVAEADLMFTLVDAI